MHKQRLLIPHNMRSLIQPVLRSAIRELHIEVPEKVRDDEAHFVVGEAKSSKVSINPFQCSKLSCFTYFIPRQFLGPVEKGWSTPFLSFENLASWPSTPGASQRSGRKLSLSMKL